MIGFFARFFGGTPSEPEQTDLFPATVPAPLSPESRRVLDEQLEQVQPVDLGEFANEEGGE